MTTWIRYTMVGALAVAMAGYGASAAIADDFDDDFGDEVDDFDDDFDDDDFDDDFDDFDDMDDMDDMDDVDPMDDPAPAVDDEVDGLVLEQGGLSIGGHVEINLSDDLVAEPISIAPDIYYGVTDELTVGLVHSGFAQSGFYNGGGGEVPGLGGSGLCITGEDDGCPDVYDNVGVNATFGFMDDDLSLAADGGVFVTSFDSRAEELLLDLKVGLLGRFDMDDLQIVFNPNVFIGLTERDAERDTLNVPVTLWYNITPEFALGAQTGFSTLLDEAGDFFRIPVAVAASFAVTDEISVGGAFSFPILVSGDAYDALDAADWRSLNLNVAYRM